MLTNYLLDGQCALSNNRAERIVKSFVISRKNFLFSKSAMGTKVFAFYFTLIETAKLNGLTPYLYLKYVLAHLPNIPLVSDDAIDFLLLWCDSDKSICKV